MDEETAQKPKRGRPKGSVKMTRRPSIRSIAQAMYVTGQWTRPKLAKYLGIPDGTMSKWAVNDKWTELRQKAEQTALTEQRSQFAVQSMIVDDRQRQIEDAARQIALTAHAPVARKLSDLRRAAEAGEEIDPKDVLAYVKALDTANLVARRNAGLPEHGKDYADHELQLLARAMVNALVPAILEAIPDSATSERVVEIVERIDWRQVFETRGRLGPAAQPVAPDAQLISRDAQLISREVPDEQEGE